ncbi:MAG: acyl-CoA dehydrogenase family protein [Chromatiales bacterium]|jgi:alkylation response protein AidB-like acyl-CoA dehydrogenase|nr:acyl-CoA dehydrogenase family protein [Chromatiales bacterium]
MPLPTEEQIIIRDMAHGWAADNAPVSALRALRDSGNELGYDAATFTTIAEMGWTGTVIPESYGGSDVGYRSMGVVLEELGRTLVAAPLISSAVGVATALKLGGTDPQKSAWLPKIADGNAIGALAIDETNHFAPESIALSAVATADGYTLSGTKTQVHEGLAANVLVVAARTNGSAKDEAGVTLFCVPSDANGLSKTRRRVVDSRGYADLTFENVKLGADAVIGTVDQGRAVLNAVLDACAAATAAETLGVAIQAFDSTLEYLKVRTQFGQLIGSFQALQHRAAKMFTDIQLVKPSVDEALCALDEGRDDASIMVSMAKTLANDLAHHISREMIQMHGGVGMTDAYDAGLYIKRTRALETAFGTSSYHRERYAQLQGM